MISILAINQELSQSTEAFVVAVNNALAAASPMGLQDVFLTRRLDLSNPRFNCTLSLASPGPVSMRAVYFTTLSGTPVDVQVAAFFAANPSYRILFTRDVSQEVRRSLDHDAVMVIYATTLLPNAGQDRSRPVIVQANALITPGSTGEVALVGASGVLSPLIMARNRGGINWMAGVRGYAQVRPGTGVWDGYPSCCP